jgi:hypothetical protein
MIFFSMIEAMKFVGSWRFWWVSWKGETFRPEKWQLYNYIQWSWQDSILRGEYLKYSSQEPLYDKMSNVIGYLWYMIKISVHCFFFLFFFVVVFLSKNKGTCTSCICSNEEQLIIRIAVLDTYITSETSRS